MRLENLCESGAWVLHYEHNEQARTGPHLVSLNAQAYYYFMHYSQIAKPLSTQYQVSHARCVEVVVGKTKSINYKLKF